MMTATVISPQGTRCTVAASSVARLERVGWQVEGSPAPAGPAETPPEAPPERPETEPGLDGGAPAGNASRGEWAAYATSLGFEVDGLKRDEIRDLVAAGK